MAQSSKTSPAWVDGNLRLAGIDSRMIALLKCIAQCGSISQAAKQCGLSYRGAWQIIERANNCAPKILVRTATGGIKGGGAALTEAGSDLLALFADLQEQHRVFLSRINQRLADNPDMRLLLQRLVVKTSVCNQIFGTVAHIERGAVNAVVSVNLADNLTIQVNLGLSVLDKFDLQCGTDAVLLINSADILVVTPDDTSLYSAANQLPAKVIRIRQDDIHAEITVLLPNNETLSCLITQNSYQTLNLQLHDAIMLIFNANAPMLGLKNGD